MGKEPPRLLPTQAAWAEPAASPPPNPEPTVPAWTADRPAPDPPPRPRDEWDEWQDRYRVSNLAGRLDMLRALLAEDHALEFYTDINFVGAVLQAPEGSGREDAYVAFLEEMFTRRPEVFKLGEDWFVRLLAYAYIRGGRERDVALLLPALFGSDCEPHEAGFDLLDLIRLAGLEGESRGLTFAMLEQTAYDGCKGSANEELVEFAVFFLCRDAIDAGCSPEALGELQKQLGRRYRFPGVTLDPMLAHRAGTADRQFTKEDFLVRKAPVRINHYLLSLDFGRWLTVERQMPPLVADTMRCFVLWCLTGMCERSDHNSLTLHQQRLDKYVAGLLGFMSLQYLRTVATLMAMGHFQDFLRSVELLNKGEHRRARGICDDLQDQVDRLLGRAGIDYAFLDRYR